MLKQKLYDMIFRVTALTVRWPHTSHVVRRTLNGTLRNGYIHAGNIAYLSLVTLLPFIILITAATAAFGQTDAGKFAIDALLNALPDNIAHNFQPVIAQVLEARTGKLLWVGGLVALWTVSTFIETLRDVSYRAFGVKKAQGFLTYRLKSFLGTLAAIAIVIVTFLLQVSFAVILSTVESLMPLGIRIPEWLLSSLNLSRFAMPAMLFLALWALLKLLSPPQYRQARSWPGALIISLAWIGTSLALSSGLVLFANMNLTYGALSGVMLAMLFFYIIGFALVLGVHTNAALAEEFPDEVPSGENMG